MNSLVLVRVYFHWIDNTSAVAALTKGYSRQPDSARLVHSLHAWCAVSQANISTSGSST